MSAPKRELSLPSGLIRDPHPPREEIVAKRVEDGIIEAAVTAIADAARQGAEGTGRQLASEALGPYQRPRPVRAKQRRRAKRVAALNHDTTRDIVLNGRNVGNVTIDELPLGQQREPQWLKRQPRLTDGQQHEVVRYQMVDGERVRVTSTAQQRSERAEEMLRRQAYQLRAGDNPDTLPVVHYWESDADHRSTVVRLVDSTATAAKAVRRNMVKAYGDVCGDCGLMHKGTC